MHALFYVVAFFHYLCGFFAVLAAAWQAVAETADEATRLSTEKQVVAETADEATRLSTEKQVVAETADEARQCELV